jgi:glycosyltransferase involved in cell wall biosynthesis
MNSVLVITPCSPFALPTQGLFIAEGLRRAGIRVGTLSQARSGLGRLLDVSFRCPWLVPRYDSALVNIYGERAFVYESLAIIVARLWEKRVVVLIHNGRMAEFVRRWPRWTRFVLSRADLVLVPHGFLQKQLSSLGLRVDDTIPNFIDLKRYKFRERSNLAPRFLYLRGMYPYYNPEMAIRAFKLVQEEHPDATLTMAGEEGKESAVCRSLACNFKLQNVSFVGLVSNNEIPNLADRHDIHLHTSRVDNMPVTIIEMWACGLPVVGTDVGGMPYLVRNGIDGILVKSEDHRAMAGACLDLLSNHVLAGMLSRNGRARAEELTWEKIKPMWEGALLLSGDCEKQPS